MFSPKSSIFDAISNNFIEYNKILLTGKWHCKLQTLPHEPISL